jgi:3-oxoacyl-[acyl-carrier-protein] synthase II
VSPIGIGWGNFWNALIAGTSGVSEVASFDTALLPNHRGAEVKNFNPASFIDKKEIVRFGRSSCLAIAAARLAVDDAGLELGGAWQDKAGICIGTTMGESQVLEKLNDAWVRRGIDAIDASLIPQYPCNVLASNVAAQLGLGGLRMVIPTACAAGNYAIGYAYDLIRAGNADLMFAGGADAFSRIAFIGFNRLFAVAPLKCQPFDKNRKGIIVGEGSGIVALEPLEAALERKAGIYAEVVGYGLSCDAHHMTAPLADGIQRAIENALKESKISPEEVDYYNAHGTGTPNNDREECLAIKKAFGQHYKKLAVSSIKSMLGHTMGAASAIEAIACCLALQNDVIPPTINYETPDPECDIDCVPNVSRKQKVRVALNNASAFGGNNACLALRKFPG